MFFREPSSVKHLHMNQLHHTYITLVTTTPSFIKSPELHVVVNELFLVMMKFILVQKNRLVQMKKRTKNGILPIEGNESMSKLKFNVYIQSYSIMMDNGFNLYIFVEEPLLKKSFYLDNRETIGRRGIQ